MQSVGKVIALFISEADKSEKNRSGKIEQEILALDSKGIIHDKYYDTNVQRSVLLTSMESYLLASSHHISMPQGALGENILIDYNPYHLDAGTRLKIGEVILEISQNCTICDHLAIIDERLPTLLKDDRGIFAKVIQKGSIQKGDEITLL